MIWNPESAKGLKGVRYVAFSITLHSMFPCIQELAYSLVTGTVTVHKDSIKENCNIYV